MSKIELKHIDKFYGKNHILKDVNLTIEEAAERHHSHGRQGNRQRCGGSFRASERT